MEFNIIYNKIIQNIIGINEELPFKITKDMIHFKNITTSTVPNKDNVVIMGFNTWKSLPNKYLPNRINIVITKKNILNIDTDKVSSFSTFEYALTYIKRLNYNKIFIIGGSVLYDFVFKNYKENIKYIYESFTHSYYKVKEDDKITYLDYNIDTEYFKCIEDKYSIVNCQVY